MYAAGSDLAAYQRYGHELSTARRAECETPMVNSYRAGDGRWFWLLCLEGERHWAGLVAALERPELETEPPVRHLRKSVRASSGTDCRPRHGVRRATLGEWATRFGQHDVWWQAPSHHCSISTGSCPRRARSRSSAHIPPRCAPKSSRPIADPTQNAGGRLARNAATPSRYSAVPIASSSSCSESSTEAAGSCRRRSATSCFFVVDTACGPVVATSWWA